MPNGSDGLHVIDIIVDRPEGGHVASVASFQAHGEACADTWAHANLIAAAPLLLHLLRQARAALPDAWSAVGCSVPRELIKAIDAAIGAATAAPPLPSPVPTPSALSCKDLAMSQAAHRRKEQARRATRRRPTELHILDFDASDRNSPGRAATVLVRGKMGQVAAISLAYDQARALGHGFAFCTGIRTVPAPRPTPALDTLTRRLTAFPTFVALLAAAAGYRPSIRLDLLGRDGLLLARAYDRRQAAWGDPRRAYVAGRIPSRAAIRSPCRAEA